MRTGGACLEASLLAGEVYRRRTESAVPWTFEVVGVLDAD